MSSRLLRFGAPLAIVVAVGGAWGHYSATARDTTLGFGNSSVGRANLPLHEDARVVFVNPDTGSDANSGLTPFVPKATPAAGFVAARDGSGDRVLIAAGSTSPKCLGAIPKRSGQSAQYPTVVSTYDATDPLNSAKYRTGKWYWGSALDGDSPLNTASAQTMQWCVFEGGHSVVPELTGAIGEDLPAGVAIFGDSQGLTENAWMFYDWSWAGVGAAGQGDWGRGILPDRDIKCNVHAGSDTLTNVVSYSEDPYAPPVLTAPAVGDHLNGKGPDSGIPYDCKVLEVNAGAGTIKLDKVCTADVTDALANADIPRYHLKKLIFRRVFFGRCADIAFYAGAVLDLVLEDCVGDLGGHAFVDRQRMPDLEMSSAAGSGAGTGTFTFTDVHGGVMTATATSTNGSAVLTNLTLLTGDPDYPTFVSVTGPGISGGTSVPSFRHDWLPNGLKHVWYFATTTVNSIVRRCMISRASSHGLQQRGGGMCADNAFIRNPINYQVGGGDHYWFAQPYGVECVGGHNTVSGGEDIILPIAPRAYGFTSAGNVKPNMSQVRNLICNYGGVAGGPYNRFPIKADQYFTPSAFNLSQSIIYNYPPAQGLTLVQVQSDPTFVNDQAKFTMVLIGNITDGDTSWNTFAGSSGNVPEPAEAYPDPDRDEESFAVAQGFADFHAYVTWAKDNLEVDHALIYNNYLRTGFAV